MIVSNNCRDCGPDEIHPNINIVDDLCVNSTSIVVKGGDNCPNGYFEDKFCSKPSGTSSDEKGTFTFTCP